METIHHALPSFVPASAGAETDTRLMLESAERFPHALSELATVFYGTVPEVYFEDFNFEKEIADALAERFEFYKTDKAAHHYHYIYGEILSRLGRDNALNILEIGLGSQNPAVASHMRAPYQCGASLRAFRDVAAASSIYGLDIDRDTLFSERRIKTAWADQTKPASFDEAAQTFGNLQYDLIIDDGLHVVSANLNTLLFGLKVLKPGGWIVIEDIWNGQVCWETVYHLIPATGFNKYMIAFDTKKRVFAIQKKPPIKGNQL